MQCDVAFKLPDDIFVIWRFAEELNTQQRDLFEEVTAGVDRLFSIPVTLPQHQGTYLCEIFREQRSIVRVYIYISVIPQSLSRYTELQEIFDLALLPGGQFVPRRGPTLPFLLQHLTVLFLCCLTTSLMLLFLFLGAMYQFSLPEGERHSDQSTEDEHLQLLVLE